MAVDHIFDGDTIEVVDDGDSVRVRLDGINAPDQGECWYREATEALDQLIGTRPVVLEVTGEDQFDRVLAYVWVGSLQTNLEMVAAGHAIATTPLTSSMAQAETEARRQQLGLWSPQACGSGPIATVEIDTRRSVVDPPGPDGDNLEGEVIYLRNPGTQPVAMGGWVLRDESSRHRFHFPRGFELGAGEVYPVRSSAPEWDPGDSPVWNNDGDIIMLLDHTGRVVSAHRY